MNKVDKNIFLKFQIFFTISVFLVCTKDSATIGKCVFSLKIVSVLNLFCIFAFKYWQNVVNGSCCKAKSLRAECWYDFRW